MTRKTARIAAVAAARPSRRREPARSAPLPRSATGRSIDMGGLEDIIGYALRRAQVAVFQDYNELTADLGITTTQFSVMRLVHRNPGLNQKTLADALDAETPRMVLITDDLERRGLVVRLASTVDRRSRAIFLTPQGRKLHRDLSGRVIRQNRRTIARLRGGDKALLLRMLRDIATPL
jgi:DNA-binding MarR family transcriptional regulator